MILNKFLILAVVILLLAGGMAGYVIANGLNNPGPQKTLPSAPTRAVATANATKNTTRNATATPTATTAVPTATPAPAAPAPQVVVIMPTATPVTAQVLILSKPADVPAGATVTIMFQVFNSVTTAGMPGVTVLVDGSGINTQIVTDAGGQGTLTFIAPQGIAGTSMPMPLQLCSAPTTPNTVGSCMGADYTLVTPAATVGNSTG